MHETAATHQLVLPESRHPRRWAIAVTALAVGASTVWGGMHAAVAQDAAPSTPTVVAAAQQLSVADVAELASPSVVTIYTFTDVQPQFGQAAGDDPAPLGAGSGWIYSADGYVVTNAHVVAGADSFTVQYEDGTQVEATLVGTDAFQDVAVLKLDLAEGEEVPAVATVGDSSTVRAGDEVVAIGSPLGEFTNTVSDGNVGGLDRELDAGNGLTLANLIQHDAEISPGNSGGPLLNMQGEVIGMNVAKLETTAANGATATGLNFAIDGNTVVGIVEEIIETGSSIERPYLGVQLQETSAGLAVMIVEPGSPADEAGIQEGDVLIGIDGTEADADTTFMELLFEHEPGDTVSVMVLRGGDTQEVEVILDERPDEIDG